MIMTTKNRREETQNTYTTFSLQPLAFSRQKADSPKKVSFRALFFAYVKNL